MAVEKTQWIKDLQTFNRRNMGKAINNLNRNLNTDRREFVKKSFIVTVSGVVGVNLLSGCKNKEEGEDQEVSPPEDLMQEHGLLNRILLIYDTCKIHLV